MHFQTFLPHNSLRSFVRFYWLLEPGSGTDQPQRLLPGAGCDLIIQIGPPARCKIGEGRWQTRRPAGFVEGHFKSFFQVRFTGGCRLAGLRFTSTGLYPFVKAPLKEFTQRFIDLVAVFGKAGLTLIQRVAELPAASVLPTVFDRFLNEQLAQPLGLDNRLEYAVQMLIKRRGMITVRRLTREAGMSERQLERAFDRHLGLSPECFAQMLRVNHFVQLARKPNRPSFTQLAYDCGYADQSHLIRAFKQHTGMTPRAYFHQQHPIQCALGGV